MTPAKQLKICHVITRMIVGGAQENTLLTVRGHLEHGHKTVLVTGPTDGPEGKLLETSPVPGLEVVTIPSLVRALAPNKERQAYLALSDYFRRHDFDVVHTHSSKAGILGRIAAWRANVPVVVHTVHGQAFHPYQSPWRNALYIRLERLAARHCHKIYAVADAMSAQCVAAGVAPAAKYQTVYSGIDLEPFLKIRRDRALAERLGIRPDAVVIGKIARIFEFKGYEYLVPIAAKVVARCPNAVFLIVGDGTLRDTITRLVQAAGLGDHFVFAGLVPPVEIPRHLSLMDVLVHLSLREGLPRVVTQAHASAIPAVAYDLDGTPEVLRHGVTGFICPPQSTHEVAEALIQLVGDQAKRQAMGQAGRAHVLRSWDWRYMVETLEQSYLDLLGERRLPASRAA